MEDRMQCDTFKVVTDWKIIVEYDTCKCTLSHMSPLKAM